MGEIDKQFRPFCFSISPNLHGNFAQFTFKVTTISILLLLILLITLFLVSFALLFLIVRKFIFQSR